MKSAIIKNGIVENIIVGSADGSVDVTGKSCGIGWSVSGSEFIPTAPTLEDFQAAHDAHLNAAAKSRKYDSIHTASLRAAYPGPWHDEGVAFAQWMDACNVAGYRVLADVEAGTRPVPTIDEYIADLPVLVLP